ncbi:MAG: endonuclease domain-containing protein [Prevotellaceae bacterium]|nr:endonuclease domain-containing protein [Prevotellaceae bacterium]
MRYYKKSEEVYGYMTATPNDYLLLKELARKNRLNMTIAEFDMWQLLRQYYHTFHFRRQHIIGDYIVDFVSLDLHLVIEIDGGYHAELQQKEADEYRTQRLNNMGFDVVRFTNDEVAEIDGVKQKLDKLLFQDE